MIDRDQARRRRCGCCIARSSKRHAVHARRRRLRHRDRDAPEAGRPTGPLPSANSLIPDMTTVLDRFLRYVRYDTQSDEQLDDVSEHREAARAAARSRRANCASSGSTDAAMDEHGYVMATIPATTRKAGRADDRLHRARRHLARDARRRRQADRPPAVRRPRPRAAGRSVGRAAARGEPGARRADRPRHRHRVGHDAARRRRQGRRRRDRDGGGVPDRASRDPARADPHRVHAGRGDRPRHAALRRRSASARAAPTRWTAAAAARSRSRASRPTR